MNGYDQQYWAMWLRQVKRNGVSKADIALAQERMTADKSSPLAIQLAWLKQVGFQDVDCWYKNYAFAVYSGRKF